MKKPMFTLAGALALVLFGAPAALAEDAHHPPGGDTPAATAAPAPQSQIPASQAMPMGGGMMGGGQAGLMMCPLMSQAGMAGMMGGPGMADMASHIDGHIAFLKADLKINPAQENDWKSFAEVLRQSAATMAQMQGMATGSPGGALSISRTFEQKERLLTSRLDNMKRLQAAWAKLDTVLTADQRKAADQVLAPRLMMM